MMVAAAFGRRHYYSGRGMGRTANCVPKAAVTAVQQPYIIKRERERESGFWW